MKVINLRNKKTGRKISLKRKKTKLPNVRRTA